MEERNPDGKDSSRELDAGYSTGVEAWLKFLADDLNDPGRAFYASTVLTAVAERLVDLDPIAHKRPLSEAILLGGEGFPTLVPGEKGVPFLLFEAVADQATAWLETHPESVVAQRIARNNLSAPLEDHLALVTEMYRDYEKEHGLSTTDTMIRLLS